MSDDAGGNSRKQNGFFSRLFKNEAADDVSEEDILLTVEAGYKNGIIDQSSRNMIFNIFSFDDTTVGELMTHRTDITAVEDTESLDKAVSLLTETGYSRIPVYHEDIDNITGILYGKDLLRFVCGDVPSDLKLSGITRKPMFVPKSINCSKVFTEMTAKKTQLAIVVDEYGGTEGIITLEDLLESIVGDIQDEYDNEEKEILKLSDNVFTVDGGISVDELNELSGMSVSSEESETVAGLMLDHLGSIPADNERPFVALDGIKLTAVKIEDRRIARVLVERIDTDAEISDKE
ncbi:MULTISPECIES: hemolysin family protein [unclassified Ruminococcus]|uniref:hemolysin family protein n=1 Tax=unclassified Ruminococcus TaxID=2608920 RepID=UPI00210E764A|nr:MULTISPECIES: hemolysin family protein [unclassified Ruminococcus]MCQ4023017.1 CBS domain-containing protein [Ruminococcus sp. zg-924]MCQ4115454.1 CBS domain-containing protein [Ruminococcus sp. zg-921]